MDKEDEDIDVIIGAAGAALFIGDESAAKINGATIDYYTDLMSTGFEVHIPNSQCCGCGKSFSIKNNNNSQKGNKMTDEYNRPPGYYKYILAIDCESTGLNWDTDDPSIGHQAVSWGIIVADAHTLIPIEKLYIEIKWNEESKKAKQLDPTFSVRASEIHGLTFAHLEEHGISEEEAVIAILELIIKYWGPDRQLHCLGHNVQAFDIPFLRAMFRRYGAEVRFSSRNTDSHSVGVALLESYTSDQFFGTMGFTDRDGHNALEDAAQALESIRRCRVMWNDFVGLSANEA